MIRQRLDDLVDTLANLKKNVRDWLKDGGDAVEGTTLPPRGVFWRSGDAEMASRSTARGPARTLPPAVV